MPGGASGTGRSRGTRPGWAGLVAALGFLTVLPARGAAAPRGGALVAFPVAGAVVGTVWAAAGWAAGAVWGAAAGAGAVLLADLVITGGLHLDAVGDVADGLAARRPPEETLAVMRDPRIGAVGAAAVGVLLLVRFGLLVALLAEPGGWLLAAGAPVAGRAAMVWALAHLTATGERRGAPGGGGSMASGPAARASMPVRAGAAGVAVLLTVAGAGLAAPVAGASGPSGTGLVVPAAVGAVAVAAGLAAAELCGRWWRRRIGLPSGDAAGASGLLAETVALAVLAA